MVPAFFSSFHIVSYLFYGTGAEYVPVGLASIMRQPDVACPRLPYPESDKIFGNRYIKIITRDS
jgi:hypothetical protein